MRTSIINQMRGFLKIFGITLKPEFAKDQERRIQQICDESPGVVSDTLAILLTVYR